MEIFYSKRFLRSFKKLPSDIKDKLEEKEGVIIKDIFASSLKTHKLNGIFEGFYAFSVDYKNRVIFEIVDDRIVFYDVGDHDIY